MNPDIENNLREQLVKAGLWDADNSLDEDAAKAIKELCHQRFSVEITVSTYAPAADGNDATDEYNKLRESRKRWVARAEDSYTDEIAWGETEQETICKAAIELHRRSLEPISAPPN